MKLLLLLTVLFLLDCQSLKIPKEKLSLYQLDNSYSWENDSLKISLDNSLRCPIRIWIQPADTALQIYFTSINPITLRPLSDTLIAIEAEASQQKEINFASRLGDIREKITTTKTALPFQKNKAYPLIQGYNSTPTHKKDWSRYAMDFGLAIGDTICAATSGFVVGVVEGYKYGGKDEKWKTYGNFITIYDPSSGLFTQYVHLKYMGSLVTLGDHVKVGQPIGLAGMTGQTNIPHLHFNCMKPIHSEDGLISIPMDSIGTYKLSTMKRNDLIVNMK